jgi:hypothetical protein
MGENSPNPGTLEIGALIYTAGSWGVLVNVARLNWTNLCEWLNVFTNAGILLYTAWTKQGCQMVCFQTKNHNLGKFWRDLDSQMSIYFMAIWDILGTFGIFYDHLVPFLFIWYICPVPIWQPWNKGPSKTRKWMVWENTRINRTRWMNEHKKMGVGGGVGWTKQRRILQQVGWAWFYRAWIGLRPNTLTWPFWL